jgi:snurportin-1
MADELAAELSVSMAVTEGNLYGEHPRFTDYKNVGRAEEKQRERRQEQLDRQKNARQEHADRLRGLYKEAEGNEDDEEQEDIEVDVSNRKRSEKINRLYADFLMTSEWLVDIPGTLSSDWIMVVCPKGKRCIVVASRGNTCAYTKKGTSIFGFDSILPGARDHKTTILDCILDRDHKRIYVLDMICWGSLPFEDSDFSCRLSFVQCKIEEDENFKKATRRRQYTFHMPPNCACTPEAMTEVMYRPLDYKIDGLLFYHSEVHYTPGQTALVGWLKPFMLPEILNVPVPDYYSQQNENAPTSRAYIDRYNQKHKFQPLKDQPVQNADGEEKVDDETRIDQE